MKLVKLNIFLLLSLYSFNLSAAIYHVINTSETLKCAFSYKHHNRIAIENNTIKKVIYPNENIISFVEENSGQVFIQSVSRGLSDKFTISIVTNDGLIQDIEINFCDIPSQVIILRNTAEPEIEDDDDCCEIKESLTLIRSNIEEILKGKIPSGYKFVDFDSFTWTPLKGVQGKTFLKLQGPCEFLYIFEVCNYQKYPVLITEEQVKNKNTKWVFLEENHIQPYNKVLGVMAAYE